MSSWWYVLPAAAILLSVFIIFFHRMARRIDTDGSAIDWLSEFSLASYAPMERLLDDAADFRFLAAEPGYRPEIAKDLRARRRGILEEYLRNLTRDFNQLLAIAKMMMVYSAQDRPELAKLLWRRQIMFYYAVTAVRFRLALYPVGVTPAHARNLVQALSRLRRLVGELTPPPLTDTISARQS